MAPTTQLANSDAYRNARWALRGRQPRFHRNASRAERHGPGQGTARREPCVSSVPLRGAWGKGTRVFVSISRRLTVPVCTGRCWHSRAWCPHTEAIARVPSPAQETVIQAPWKQADQLAHTGEAFELRSWIY